MRRIRKIPNKENLMTCSPFLHSFFLKLEIFKKVNSKNKTNLRVNISPPHVLRSRSVFKTSNLCGLVCFYYVK